MKAIFAIAAGISLFSTSLFSQNINHPTIEKVQASYRPLPSQPNASATAGPADIKVQGKTNITLKTISGLNKVYLKITDKQTNTVVYEVNYLISSSPVSDPSGIVLYKKDNNVITINDPTPISLKPFLYEVYTDDSQGNKSVTYSITQ